MARTLLVPDVYLGRVQHADRERFARIFRETWERIPLDARKKILTYWCEMNERKKSENPYWGGYDSPAYPHIECLEICGNYGQCEEKGEVIRFWSPGIDWLPEEHLCSIIAHELAHVWHYANGMDGTVDEKEEWANKESLSWGFVDTETRNNWAEEHKEERQKLFDASVQWCRDHFYERVPTLRAVTRLRVT